MNPESLAIWRAYHSRALGGGTTGGTLLGQFYPQVLYDYDGTGKLIYVGIGSRGALTSDANWMIWKLTYSGDNVVSQKSSLPQQIWDNRATSVTYA